jgi:hypothetical protein
MAATKNARVLAATVIVTVTLTAVGLAAIAAAFWYATPPIPHDAAFAAQVTVDSAQFYAGQPAKTRAYEAAALAAPVLVALVFFAARNRLAACSEAFRRGIVWTGFALLLLLFIWCAFPMVYCPKPPLALVPPRYMFMPVEFPRPWLTPFSFCTIAGGVLLGFLFLARRFRHPNLVMIPLLTLWFVLAPVRFYAPDEINYAPRFTYHLNSVFHALSQSVNGRHYLVDFPHIYGGYVEILAPFIRLFPRTLKVPLLAMAVPGVLGLLTLLLSARLIIRPPVLLWVCGLGLFATTYMISTDPYYNYNLARAVLPSIAVWLSILYFRRPGRTLYGATSVLAAIATVWNLDTGVVLWASWAGTLFIMEITARRWRRAFIQVAIQAGLLIAIWLAFFIYLRLVSGAWPDPGLVLYFQTFVLSSGYFCLPLLVPDTWLLLAGLYLIGLATALIFYFRGQANWKTHVTLMLSLLGIGLFSYFMGRSAESNLLGGMYTAILLLGLLTGEALRLARAGKLPAVAPFFFAPYLLALGWWSALFLADQPSLLIRTVQMRYHWSHPVETPVLKNAAFVKAWTRPGEDDICILSGQSGVYYYLSDTVSVRPLPGTIEWLRRRDFDALLTAIRQRSIAKLFDEDSFYALKMYRPDIYASLRDTIAQNYRVVATSDVGNLHLCVPR